MGLFDGITNKLTGKLSEVLDPFKSYGDILNKAGSTGNRRKPSPSYGRAPVAGDKTLSTLKSRLGLGARTNKYKVLINPIAGGSAEMLNTLVKSASIPSRSFTDVQVIIQGKPITIAGEAQYEGSWSVTFYDTQDHDIRSAIIAWMDYIDDFNSVTRGASNASSYLTTAAVQQLDTSNNNVTAEYTLYNVYPKSISDTQLSDDSTGLVEFSVDFSFSSWRKTI